MTKDKGILIKNIYYMLTYAFQILRQSGYDEIAAEEFENIHDLFASILLKGIAKLIKQGIYRDYVTKCDNLSVLRGKLDIYGTIKNKYQRRQMLSCEYDEMSENNLFNQILKTTATILQRQSLVSEKHKKALKKLMLFLNAVDIIEPSDIQWNRLKFHRNNQHYKMLLNICYFVLDGLLLSTEKGKYKMATFLDEQHMSRLFEKFVLEYYRYHYPKLHAASSQIAWNVDDVIIDYLPIMKTDITLRFGEKILIIDTKYYSRTMQIQNQYDSQTLHSNNLYQIFTYVKNLDVRSSGIVAGMILYAKTEEIITPDYDFLMSGNKISVKTLDLSISFPNIAAQLDRYATSYFGDTKSK
ncbi:MAG: 5-methylcytosine-specific restriction endonuclease system specificity protein McrC [Balneolaceae bacterium]